MKLVTCWMYAAGCCYCVQVSSIPRLLACSGQGFGYAVAWSLVHLLTPSLLQHMQRAAAAELEPLQPQQPAFRAAAGAIQGTSNCGEGWSLQECQEQWRELLSMGVELSDARVLASMIFVLQQQQGGRQQARGPQRLHDMLQAKGLWPIESGTDSHKVWSVCLACSILSAVDAV